MLRQRYFFWTIFASLIIIQLMMWAIFLHRQLLPPQVPLYYFRPWGEGQLASALELWLIPAVCGGIFVLNTVIAWRLYRAEKILAQIVTFASLIVSILGLIFLTRILSLVTG